VKFIAICSSVTSQLLDALTVTCHDATLLTFESINVKVIEPRASEIKPSRGSNRRLLELAGAPDRMNEQFSLMHCVCVYRVSTAHGGHAEQAPANRAIPYRNKGLSKQVAITVVSRAWALAIHPQCPCDIVFALACPRG
jgi:hypothetical protein